MDLVARACLFLPPTFNYRPLAETRTQRYVIEFVGDTVSLA